MDPFDPLLFLPSGSLASHDERTTCLLSNRLLQLHAKQTKLSVSTCCCCCNEVCSSVRIFIQLGRRRRCSLVSFFIPLHRLFLRLGQRNPLFLALYSNYARQVRIFARASSPTEHAQSGAMAAQAMHCDQRSVRVAQSRQRGLI